MITIQSVSDLELLRESVDLKPSSPHLESSSPHLEPSSPHLEPSSPRLAEERDTEGRLLSEHLPLSVVDDLSMLSDAFRASLEAMALEPRRKKKVGRDVLIGVVLKVCTGHFVTLRCLAELVQRTPKVLRDQYLSGLVRKRELSLAFPITPTHERQAYCAACSLTEQTTSLK